MAAQKFDYKKVRAKYEDSLSQYDFDTVFNNPDHGSLKFSEIQDEFENLFKIIYDLTALNRYIILAH